MNIEERDTENPLRQSEIERNTAPAEPRQVEDKQAGTSSFVGNTLGIKGWNHTLETAADWIGEGKQSALKQSALKKIWTATADFSL